MYDVVIAGAGPVGLFLACELRLQNLSVLVLEQLADPHSPLKQLPFGMRGLWGPSVEAFYRRGLLDQIAAGPTAGRRFGETSGPAGHFAGIPFDRANIDPSRWTYRLPGPADTQIGSSTEHIEKVLTAHALATGVEIRRGQPITGFTTAGDEVIIDTIHARWLVGCDGGRSTVRKLAGFDFVGTEPEFTGYSLSLELGELPLGRIQTEAGMCTQWRPGFVAIIEFDRGAYDRSRPVTVEHAQAVIRRVTGIDVTVTQLHYASTWTDRSKQATTYRKGRVLLCGDAAHVHSPLGGQGLNLGLGDAMNLGWKLATGDDALIDTYTTERHPIGARVLDWTRAQVAVMKSRALDAIMRDVMATRDGATYFAERVWGVTNRYNLGDAHPLVGRSCPDFELGDGTRVGELLRDGKWHRVEVDKLSVLVRPDGVVVEATSA